MIRIPEALAQKVEEAATKTLDQYGIKWQMLSAEVLLTKRDQHLEWFSQSGSAVLENITEPITDGLQRRLVELAVIQRILVGPEFSSKPNLL